MRLVLAAVLVAAFAAEARAGFDMVFAGDPYPGIHRETWDDSAIPARVRLVRIDLTSSEIALYATAENDRGMTTSDYAARKGAQVAINGDAFAVNGYTPRGLAVGDSNSWSNTSDDIASAVFHLRRSGERTVAAIEPPETLVGVAELPPGTEGVISGRPLLVRQSQVETSFDCNDQVTLACVRAPRTAIAVSPNGNVLWLAVVDGWQSGSLGVTASELAAFLRDRGAGMAMALDGGSSSTLVLAGDVISSPSDGVERTVANHLAVKYGSLPKGELYGLICKDSVIGCATAVPSRKISGASVALDDGRQIVTDTSGQYDFLNVTARLACVTVRKTGYLTKTQCQQVAPGQINYNSVALYEGVDPPDAGVGPGEDAGIGVDATVPTDGRTGDGGNNIGGDGPGCCETGGSTPNPVLVVVVALFLVRRRGTTAAGP
jgi:exopolysaccharide biosynthesis protein